MRLLISGYAGAGNAGDEAILGGLLRTIRSGSGATTHRITVVSSDPAQTERLHGVAAVPRLRPATLAAIRDADAVLSGGGGLFQDVTSGRPPLYYGGLTELARALGRPYAILAQGLGPLRGGLQRRVTARALERASHVSLRDQGSIELARALGVQLPIDAAPDLALGLEAPDVEPAARIVVAMRGRGLDDGRLRMLREAVGSLATDLEVVALPMHEPDDRAASVALVEGMRHGRVSAPATGYRAALEIIASARLVIGMRLHALVLAALAGVPVVAFPYDPKVEAFAASAGQPIARPGSGADGIRIAADEALAADPARYRARVAALADGVAPAVAAALEAIG